MRVFVTGASGWIGSAVVPELIGAGHQVVGLARSDASAAALDAAGAEVHRGTLDDLDSLQERGRRVRRRDPPGVQARHRLLRATSRAPPMPTAAPSRPSARRWRVRIDRSSSPPGRSGSRRGGWPPNGTGRGNPRRIWRRPAVGRPPRELTLSLADRGVRSSVVRLPPTVHGDGDNGFMATLVGIARDKGVSGYIGDGANRWPAVHRLDAARLFRLALEKAPAGSALHAVADEGVPVRDIAEVIGRHLDVPVASISPEDAGEHFGWLARLPRRRQPGLQRADPRAAGLAADPPGLLDDLDKGHYFDSPSA